MSRFDSCDTSIGLNKSMCNPDRIISNSEASKGRGFGALLEACNRNSDKPVEGRPNNLKIFSIDSHLSSGSQDLEENMTEECLEKGDSELPPFEMREEKYNELTKDDENQLLNHKDVVVLEDPELNINDQPYSEEQTFEKDDRKQKRAIIDSLSEERYLNSVTLRYGISEIGLPELDCSSFASDELNLYHFDINENKFQDNREALVNREYISDDLLNDEGLKPEALSKKEANLIESKTKELDESKTISSNAATVSSIMSKTLDQDPENQKNELRESLNFKIDPKLDLSSNFGKSSLEGEGFQDEISESVKSKKFDMDQIEGSGNKSFIVSSKIIGEVIEKLETVDFSTDLVTESYETPVTQISHRLSGVTVEPSGSKLVTISLHPEELGVIEIELTANEAGKIVQISVTAKEPETLRILTEGRNILDADLKRIDTAKDASLSFSLGQGEAREHSNNQNSRLLHSDNILTGIDSSIDGSSSTNDVTQSVYISSPQEGGVDIRV
jgi:hypothetical protein